MLSTTKYVCVWVPHWKPASLEVMWASGLVWAGHSYIYAVLLALPSSMCWLHCQDVLPHGQEMAAHCKLGYRLSPCHLGKESPVCHISIDLGNCIPLKNQSLRPQGGHWPNWHVWPGALLWILKQYHPDLMAATQWRCGGPSKEHLGAIRKGRED